MRLTAEVVKHRPEDNSVVTCADYLTEGAWTPQHSADVVLYCCSCGRTTPRIEMCEASSSHVMEDPACFWTAEAVLHVCEDNSVLTSAGFWLVQQELHSSACDVWCVMFGHGVILLLRARSVYSIVSGIRFEDTFSSLLWCDSVGSVGPRSCLHKSSCL